MTADEKKWLIINRNIFFENSIPALQVLDFLVAAELFMPTNDDYQAIVAEPALRNQIRRLLDALPSKGRSVFDVFISSLKNLCPQVLNACSPRPQDILQKLDEDLRDYIKAVDQQVIKPLSWLEEDPHCPPITVAGFFPNLALVGKVQADRMISERTASSAQEGQRCDYLFSQAHEQDLVQLENVFEDLERDNEFRSSVNSEVSEHSVEYSLATPSRWLVGIYGGAGCGKTASLMKLYSLYAREQLWKDRFKLFLFWKLRDAEVQQAETLEHLLAALPSKPSPQRCIHLASALRACEGKHVLLVLDGVDELDAGRKAFVRKLLNGSALPNACVLATSRPCTAARSYFAHYNSPPLELLGFTEGQVEFFMKERFSSQGERLRQLQGVLAQNTSLDSLMIVPLLATMVCGVFSATSSSPPTTRTELYSKLLVLIVQRAFADDDEGRLHVSSEEMDALLAVEGVQQLPAGRAKRLLLEIAEVAYHAFKANLAVFDQLLLRKAKCSSEALRLGLLVNYGQKQVEQRLLSQYSFQHLTVQEFLVAFYLADQITSADLDKSETLLEKMMSKDLGMGPHQTVVVQFLAGLLPAHLHSIFFPMINTWLDKDWYVHSRESQERLRCSLYCVREARRAETFPEALRLPKGGKVSLDRVSANDVELLALLLSMSPSTLKELWLEFSKVESEAEESSRRLGRIKTQTKQSMEKLLAVLAQCTALQYLSVSGPQYELLSGISWQHLVKTVKNDSLIWLNLHYCCLYDDDIIQLSGALQHTTQLRSLYLEHNMIADRGVCALADVLQRNHTVRRVHLYCNSYGPDSAEYVKRQLSHIKHGSGHSLCSDLIVWAWSPK